MGEIRTKHAASEALRVSLGSSRQMVVATIRGLDVVTALDRLMTYARELDGEVACQNAAQALQGIAVCAVMLGLIGLYFTLFQQTHITARKDAHDQMMAMVVLLLVLGRLTNSGITEVQKQAVAEHLRKVTEATVSYGRAHYKALLDKVTATKGDSINIADLIREEFLPVGFNAHNPWGQTYTIHAREPKAGELQLVVLTEGGRAHETTHP